MESFNNTAINVRMSVIFTYQHVSPLITLFRGDAEVIVRSWLKTHSTLVHKPSALVNTFWSISICTAKLEWLTFV